MFPSRNHFIHVFFLPLSLHVLLSCLLLLLALSFSTSVFFANPLPKNPPALEIFPSAMPYPMFKSNAHPKPVISRPLPLRSYQDHESQSSRWSMSETSEHSNESYPLPSHWPTLIPSLPPKSPLRTRLNRPHAPPALMRSNFHAARQQNADLGYYFGEAMQPPMTAATTISSSSSSNSVRSLTPSPASAPPSHTTFAATDPSFNRWLVATVRHQHHINSSRQLASAAAAAAATTRSAERDLPPPPTPPKNDQDSDYDDDDYDANREASSHARSASIYDYTNYLQQNSSSIPPPSSLSLCNSSGWSSVARRTARSP